MIPILRLQGYNKKLYSKYKNTSSLIAGKIHKTDELTIHYISSPRGIISLSTVPKDISLKTSGWPLHTFCLSRGVMAAQ